MPKMTERQKRFVSEYLIDLNAKQAAIRAGYSPNTASVIGPENLAKLCVRSAVDKAIAARAVRTGVSQDRVVRELARIAFMDPTRVIDFQKGVVMEDLSEDDRAVLSGVKVKDGEVFTEREVKLLDKLKALELLGKHMGMFTEKVALEGMMPVTIVDDVESGP